MSLSDTEIADFIYNLGKYHGDFDKVGATAARWIQRAEELEARRKLERQLAADIKEGTIEGLLRAKETMNNLFDSLIRRALDHSDAANQA